MLYVGLYNYWAVSVCVHAQWCLKGAFYGESYMGKLTIRLTIVFIRLVWNELINMTLHLTLLVPKFTQYKLAISVGYNIPYKCICRVPIKVKCPWKTLFLLAIWFKRGVLLHVRGHLVALIPCCKCFLKRIRLCSNYRPNTSIGVPCRLWTWHCMKVAISVWASCLTAAIIQ